MKSNSARPPAVVRFGTVFVIAVSALGMFLARRALVRELHGVRVNADVYALPSPEQTVVMSLGYRAALADVLYGHVLVSYGLHFQERRLFEFVGNYLDTINALDPKFRAPYRFADTLLTLQPRSPPLSHYRKAREILERGLRELPEDAELWNSAGQFIAYLARARLPTQEEKLEWERRGAFIMARACELYAATDIQAHCLTTAGLLTRSGERQAAIRFLERVVAVSEDPSVRESALDMLGKELNEQMRERAARRRRSFIERYQRSSGFLSEGAALVVGPDFDVARCAGPSHADGPACATSWRAWARALD